MDRQKEQGNLPRETEAGLERSPLSPGMTMAPGGPVPRSPELDVRGLPWPQSGVDSL